LKALSRRDFLKLSGAAFAGALLPRSWRSPQASNPAEWPAGVPLGRVTPKRIRLVSRPHPDGERLDYKYEDDVLPVLRSVVGTGFYPHNHVWFETPDGYAYSSWVQPVRFDPNEPLPVVSGEGIYVELSVPYSDAAPNLIPNRRLFIGCTTVRPIRLTTGWPPPMAGCGTASTTRTG
jgi:hypothetical protein